MVTGSAYSVRWLFVFLSSSTCCFLFLVSQPSWLYRTLHHAQSIIFFLSLFLFGRFDVVAIIHHHRHRQRSDSIGHLSSLVVVFRPFSPPRLLVTSDSRCRLSSSSRHPSIPSLASNNSFRPTRPWTSCYLQLLETVPSKRIGTSSLIHGVKMFILWYSDLSSSH